MKVVKSKWFLFVLLLTFIQLEVFSYPNGITGYTKKTNTAGCASCHSSLSAAVNVVIAGPSQLTTGQTANYTVTISGGPGTKVGTDIATSLGTLANIDNNLQLLNGELTHLTPKSFSGGQYVFNFSLTAPASAGPLTLYANGVSKFSSWNFAPNFAVNVVTSTDVNENLGNYSFSLNQNYPNPFNPTTNIVYQLAEKSFVQLNVYDVLGNLVSTLANGEFQAGNHTVTFDAAKLSSGVYYYTLKTNKAVITKKMMLVK